MTKSIFCVEYNHCSPFDGPHKHLFYFDLDEALSSAKSISNDFSYVRIYRFVLESSCKVEKGDFHE